MKLSDKLEPYTGFYVYIEIFFLIKLKMYYLPEFTITQIVLQFPIISGFIENFTKFKRLSDLSKNMAG